ncbi:hypothetical protein H0H93_012029 [Arthromyces matolae]|nr:hypothetical protein H0H93_012029 [Arthromyces matolae]
MDIFNRPPTIAEDTLQYTIHLPKDLSDKASAITFAACITTYAEDLLPGFIWHRDTFELKVIADPDPDNNAYILEGKMRVGDCVDDEWCTVWLLKEITAKWDVVVSVFDSDGEFLLIEAAEALPLWVKPTNSENRVWIYNSRLHLIPLSHTSPPSRRRHRRQLLGVNEDESRDNEGIEDDDDEYVCAQDAIKLVRDPSVHTFAPDAVQELVWHRIFGYPSATHNHMHKTKAYLPKDVANALLQSPFLVQKAVETFYTRDAVQLRAAHRMNRFPPNENALSTVKMTRTAYAQLVGQKFFPPKIFGRWSEPEGSREWRWRDVGMKIAVGFEMLYQESKSRAEVTSASAESAEARKDALRRNPEYLKYIENLRSASYFRDEVEGSELWRTLEDKAAKIFVDVRKEDDATRPSFASQVNTALTLSSKTRPLASVEEEEEDSDDWLNINAQDFDAMLEQSMNASDLKAAAPSDAMDVDTPEIEDETAEDRLASAQAAKLKDLAARVENFVEGEGDLEGAMLEDDVFSDEDFSDDELGTEDDNEVSDPGARDAAMDKLVPGIEPSEYGKMPASFYSNSQRVAQTNADPDQTEQQTQSKKEAPVKPIRQPIIPRDKYDGVDSDDETDEEEVEDEESEDEHPQVVGDVEIDMEEEEEEFLEFSRQALGITDDQWGDIIQERKERGAFVPTSAKNTPAKKTTQGTQYGSPDTHGRPPAPGPRPNVNPNLDSFEALMEAMDAELSRLRPSNSRKATTTTTTQSSEKRKGKAKATVEDEDEDIEGAMDAELKAALEDGDDDDEEDTTEPPDYNLIKNFLESFKSQAGLSGPVSNLAGMLQPGWQLPRDGV